MRRTHFAIFGGVLLAAAGLAVLAARSLDAQRLVLEQAAAESGRREAETAAREWRGRIDAAAKPYFDTLPDSGSAGALAAALSKLEDRPAVAAAFGMDRNGRVTWPPPPEPARVFVDYRKERDDPGRDALARGYRAEFVDHDTAAALKEYEAAGLLPYGQTVRVEAKLQEAALAAKIGAPARAVEAYGDALLMGRYTEPEKFVAASLARAKLRQGLDPDGAEQDVLALAASLFGADALRYGSTLQASRDRVAEALAGWTFSAPGRQRWEGLVAQAAKEKAATEARERAAGLAAALGRTKDPSSYAALDGGLLAAWRPKPGGGVAGIVLRSVSLGLSGRGALCAAGGTWAGSAPAGGPSAPVPGANGLAVTIAPGDEVAAAVRRQRGLFLGGLVVLMSALAAGLWASFRSVRREAELARLKSDFVAQVSHELKTPLALVRMYAETLAAGKIEGDAQKKEYMDVILRESERLSGMIEKILDFARLERGEVQFQRRSGDLAAAAREAAGGFAKTAGVAVAVDAPKSVRAAFDPEGMQLALRNLLENAVKYSEGKPEITVRVGERNGTASVAVEDRGIGVAASDRERIFDRFFRAGDPKARKVKGTGLGLALVARVMEGHGGAARCEGRDGGGSRFILEFPRSENASNHPRH